MLLSAGMFVPNSYMYSERTDAASMHSIRLHPLSLVLGFVAALGIGAAQASFTAVPIAVPHAPVLGVVPGSWWETVVITPSSPYVVPNGSYFVVSLLDGVVNDLRIDGQAAIHLQSLYSSVERFQNDARVAFAGGTVLSTVNASSVTAFGYLDPR